MPFTKKIRIGCLVRPIPNNLEQDLEGELLWQNLHREHFRLGKGVWQVISEPYTNNTDNGSYWGLKNKILDFFTEKSVTIALKDKEIDNQWIHHGDCLTAPLKWLIHAEKASL